MSRKIKKLIAVLLAAAPVLAQANAAVVANAMRHDTKAYCPESLANDKNLLRAQFPDKKINVKQEVLIVEGDSYYRCPEETRPEVFGNEIRCRANSMFAINGYEMPVPVFFGNKTIVSNAFCGYYILIE